MGAARAGRSFLRAAVAFEFVPLRGEPTVERVRQIRFADFVLGMLRVRFFDKGADYYLHSIPFIAKVSLFVIVALLSIYPTLQFLSWKAACAALMARGIGSLRL